MSTIKTTYLSTQGGSTVPVDTVVNGSAKAWVNFNGTGTVAIRAGFNVSSITDNGAGDYTVNFITAMPDAAFTILALSGNVSSPGTSPASGYPVDTLSARVGFFNTAATFLDRVFAMVAIFR